MNDKVRRIRCGTKKCAGFIDTQVSTVAKSRDGNWQFHCPVCNFWSLAWTDGGVKATSKEQFDLERLSTSLRLPMSIRREPAGGV